MLFRKRYKTSQEYYRANLTLLVPQREYQTEKKKPKCEIYPKINLV